MKKLSESVVEKILKEHELWLKTDGEKGGRADFSDMDLSGMNFYGRDLREAWFDEADLTHANFQNENLRKADFCEANLKNADFRGADLTGADFDNTYADNMIYDETTLPSLACPEEGSFIGYKKASSIEGPYKDYILKLRIPADAKRNSATENKCRCSKAKVLSITELDGTKVNVKEVCSFYDPNFIYRLGETVKVPDFDECRWHNCTYGIHFFMNRKDAAAVWF